MEDAVFRLHAELEDRHWWFEGRRRIVFGLIERLMASSPGGTIIDVGCGTGGTIAPLATRFATLGIDTSPLAIDYACAKYPGSTFRLGRMPDDLRDVAADTALYLLMDVLEHVPDDRGFLDKLITLAQPGAHILVTVPAEPELWSQHDVMAGHLRRYLPDSLRAVWTGLPVSEVMLAPFNTRLFPLIWLVRRLGHLAKRTAGHDGTDFRLPPAPLNRLLTDLFGGERAGLLRRLDRTGHRPAGRGVSLLAILRKEPAA